MERRSAAIRPRELFRAVVGRIEDDRVFGDAEIIELGLRFYRLAGLDEVEVLLNSIGDGACRPGYVAALTAYYEPHADRLPALERERLHKNPLRLLDSKDPAMAELNAAAPRITDQLCEPCQVHFAEVREHLAVLGVAFRLEPALVRGLDYYTRTAFEYYLPGRQGQQQALGGGGRYDGLVELLGGHPTPGIGFGLGLDRIVLALQAKGVKVTSKFNIGAREVYYPEVKGGTISVIPEYNGALLTTFPSDVTMAKLPEVEVLAQGGTARVQR